MEVLSTWVLSIIGIVVLSVLLDLFMPDGEMCLHVKNIVNFSVILVIILPLPTILKQEINIESFINKEEMVLQN